MTYNGTALHFSYDANGHPLSLVYGGNTYYYATNLQGDVVAILDSTGAAVVTYLGYSAAMNTVCGLLLFGINITFASEVDEIAGVFVSSVGSTGLGGIDFGLRQLIGAIFELFPT